MKMARFILPLLAVLLIALPASAYTGPLTSGNYTYLLAGRSMDIPVDILPMKGGHLVPVELLRQFDITVTEKGTDITLVRGPVRIELEHGSRSGKLDGARLYLNVAPTQIAGRNFVPDQVLSYLAVDFLVDGKFVLLENYNQGGPNQSPSDELLSMYRMTAYFRDGASTGYLTAVNLTYDLLAHNSLKIHWGHRQKMARLLEDYTLIYFEVHNQSPRAVKFDLSMLYAVDVDGKQHEPIDGMEFPVTGLVSSPTAPNVRQAAVVAFPKVADGRMFLYHDAAGNVLGSMPGR